MTPNDAELLSTLRAANADSASGIQAVPRIAEIAAVRVVDLDIPFGSMVWLILKWVVASIPALIVLALIGAALGGVFAALMAGVGLSR